MIGPQVYALRIIVTLSLVMTAAVSVQASNESDCNMDIAKTVRKLKNAYSKVYSSCVRDGGYCSTNTNRVLVKADAVYRGVSSTRSACFAAVNSDGVPLSNFGPGAVCPARYTTGAADLPITTLEELADCLIDVTSGHARRLVDRLDLLKGNSFFVYPDKNEAKCIRNAYRFAVKAWKSGLREVERCARGATKPFNCPLDLTAESKFVHGLAGIDRGVAKCKAADGTRASISGDVLRRCHSYIDEPADLAACIRKAVVCIACRDVNAIYELGEDCGSLAQSRTCTGVDRDIALGTMAVTNEGDDTVTLYDNEGQHLFGGLAASSFAVGADPSDAVFNRLTNTLIVANRSSDSVTFLVGSTGEYVAGSFIASTFAVGVAPVALALNPERGLLFVANQGDDTVTVLDALDGQPAFGSLQASTVMVGSQPSGIAFVAGTETVAVTNAGDSTLVMLDGTTADYVGGGLGAATHPTLATPVDVLAQSGVVVASEIDQAVAVHDSATGLPRYGTLPASTVSMGFPVSALGPRAALISGPAVHFYGANMVSSSTDTLVSLAPWLKRSPPVGTGPVPIAVGGHSGSAYAFVVEQAAETLTNYDSGDSFAASRFAAGRSNSLNPSDTNPHRLAVNEANDTVYMTNARTQSVTFFDALTGAFKFGTLSESTFYVGFKATNIAVSATHDRVYVTGKAATVTYLNATTGAYIGGSLAAASITVDGSAYAIAVNEIDGIVYVSAWNPAAMIYLDPSTPAYLGGSLEAASIATLVVAVDIEVDPAAGIVYAVGNETLLMLDAKAPGYHFPTLAESSFDVGQYSFSLAVNPAANIVFVGTNQDILYYDATTGAQMAGTATGLSSPYLAANPTTGQLYSTQVQTIHFTRYARQISVLDFNSTSGAFAGNGGGSTIGGEGFLDIVLHESSGVLWGRDSYSEVAAVVAFDVNAMSYAFADNAPVQSVSTGAIPTSLAIAQ